MTEPQPTKIFLKIPSTDFSTNIQLILKDDQAYLASLSDINLLKETLVYSSTEILPEDEYSIAQKKYFNSGNLVFLNMIASYKKVRKFKCFRYQDALVLKKYAEYQNLRILSTASLGYLKGELGLNKQGYGEMVQGLLGEAKDQNEILEGYGKIKFGDVSISGIGEHDVIQQSDLG